MGESTTTAGDDYTISKLQYESYSIVKIQMSCHFGEQTSGSLPEMLPTHVFTYGTLCNTSILLAKKHTDHRQRASACPHIHLSLFPRVPSPSESLLLLLQREAQQQQVRRVTDIDILGALVSCSSRVVGRKNVSPGVTFFPTVRPIAVPKQDMS